jgi:hypothetical protein
MCVMCRCYPSPPASLALYLAFSFSRPSGRVTHSSMWRNRHNAPPFTRLFSSLYYSFPRLLIFFFFGPLCDLLSCVCVLPMNLVEHPVVCFSNQILLGTFHNPLFSVVSQGELLNQRIPPSLLHLPSFSHATREKQEVKGGWRAIGCLASPFIPKFGIGTTIYFEDPPSKNDATFLKMPTPTDSTLPVKATVEWNWRFPAVFSPPHSFSRLLVPSYCVTRSLFPSLF